MKCPFCAEEIKDEAIVCRFCGAVKRDGGWRLDAPARSRRASSGSFTLRAAGVLFGLSAVYELIPITAKVPLFGALRGGPAAVIYHLLFATLFLALGIGLLWGKGWGYPLVFGGTSLYTLDKLLYVLDRPGKEAQLNELAGGYPDLLNFFDKDFILLLLTLTALLFMVCWWGFAAYVYTRRSYFIPNEEKRR